MSVIIMHTYRTLIPFLQARNSGISKCRRSQCICVSYINVYPYRMAGCRLVQHTVLLLLDFRKETAEYRNVGDYNARLSYMDMYLYRMAGCRLLQHIVLLVLWFRHQTAEYRNVGDHNACLSYIQMYLYQIAGCRLFQHTVLLFLQFRHETAE